MFIFYKLFVLEKLRIIVGGYIGLYPTGGATWDYIQYPLGLKMLGHDVYYIEDTMQYPVFQTDGKAWSDATASILYLKKTMESFGLQDRWAYRDIASGRSFGMTDEKILEICKSADVFINISCSTYLRDEYLQIPKRVLIDSDPMFTQIQYGIEMEGLAEGKDWNTKRLIENHNFLFTFGENIGAVDCKIPQFGFKWYTTRQPVCIDIWQNKESVYSSSFTSIMNWSGRKKLVYDNQEWGQKDIEFEKFKEMPVKMPCVQFEVVINKPINKESNFNAMELENLGWKILNPKSYVSNIADYRSFILNSAGEFSVAKETYVKSNSGWFSCRSACYLAAGKPVVTQETGWSNYIPAGSGLFSFNNMESAIEAIKIISKEPKKQSIAALELSRSYFDSNIVLKDLISKLN